MLVGSVSHLFAKITIAFLYLIFAVASSYATETKAIGIPKVTTSVGSQLSQHLFRELQPGVVFFKIETKERISVSAFKFDTSQLVISLNISSKSAGSAAKEAPADAILSFNGGFFSKSSAGELNSVGYLRQGGRRYSKGWLKAGGYIRFKNDGIEILPTNANPIPRTGDVLQSKPVLIEPGGVWAMNRNRKISKSRTILCELDENELLLAIFSGRGMSLYEAGWLMRSPEVGGVFGCDTAIALDGGGSTQLWVKGRPDLAVEGNTAVHNLITVRKRP